MALDVFGDADLKSHAVANLTDLTGTMPSVQIDDLGTARGIANIKAIVKSPQFRAARADEQIETFLVRQLVRLGFALGSLNDECG